MTAQSGLHRQRQDAPSSGRRPGRVQPSHLSDVKEQLAEVHGETMRRVELRHPWPQVGPGAQ